MNITKLNEIIPYERLESGWGMVTSRCKSGAFVLMDNGERAFARTFGNLKEGTFVMFTVLKKATEKQLAAITIESIECAIA